jgi:prevent-host-death family protein
MVRRVSVREARVRFAELTDRVLYTGEPVIVEKQGQAFVALISLEDLNALQRLQGQQRQAKFSGLAGRAAQEAGGLEPSEEEIVQAVKATRRLQAGRHSQDPR